MHGVDIVSALRPMHKTRQEFCCMQVDGSASLPNTRHIKSTDEGKLTPLVLLVLYIGCVKIFVVLSYH
jgi:hypothetical protein